jgi:uncharacterized protein
MDRTVMWMQWNNLGMEQLHIEDAPGSSPDQRALTADGVVVGVREGRPYRARYRIDSTQNWQVQNLHIELLDASRPALSLRSDGEGRWWQSDDRLLPNLNGCVDVDLSATPFTNTLAIRRLALQPGEVRNLSVVYIAVPQLTIQAVPQRYTCLEVNSQGGIYRYEGLMRNFSVDLLVDRDGLVIEYPKAFRRVWSVTEPR